MDDKEGEIVFGGLDLQPRLNTALNLAKHHKAPKHIIDSIKDIRKSVQGGLSDRRNMAIHGVHSDSEIPESVKLHMARWGGDRKTSDVSPEELHQIAIDIGYQVSASLKLLNAIGVWKFGSHLPET